MPSICRLRRNALACVELDLAEYWCWLAVHVDAVGMSHGCVGVRMLMRGVVCCGNYGDGAMCAIVVDENSGDAVVSATLCWLLASVGEFVLQLLLCC